MSTSRDIRISILLEAVMLDFWLPVTSDSILIVPLDSLPPKTWGSRWNFVHILSMSWDLGCGNHPPGHFTVFNTDSPRSKMFLKFIHRKMWKWVAQRYTEAFVNNLYEKYGVWKTQGVTTPLGSSRVNSAARVVTKPPKFHHITPILKSLHWLKISERIKYKVLCLTHKSLKTGQPSFLRSLLSFPSHRCTRSSSLITLSRFSYLSSLNSE